MSEETSADQERPLTEIAKEMGDRRERILTVLWHDGDGDPPGVNTREVRRHADIPPGSIHHYLTHLQELGLVEIVDREMAGGGNPARVWQLTDRGVRYLEEDPRGRVEQRVDPERVRELERRVESVEQEVEKVRDAVEEIRDVLL